MTSAHAKEREKARNSFLTLVLIVAGLALIYQFVLRSWFSVINCFVIGSQWNYDSMTCEYLPPAEKVILPKDFIGTEFKLPEQDRVVIIDSVMADVNDFPAAKWGDLESPERGILFIDTKNSIYVKDKIISPIIINSGGIGSFIYLSSFDILEDNSIVHEGEYFFLGDRIVIESLVAENAGDGTVINLDYLTHGENQPFSERPNVLVKKKFIFNDGKLSPANP